MYHLGTVLVQLCTDLTKGYAVPPELQVVCVSGNLTSSAPECLDLLLILEGFALELLIPASHEQSRRRRSNYGGGVCYMIPLPRDHKRHRTPRLVSPFYLQQLTKQSPGSSDV
ncbi:hypothetical protein CEXT_104301 [Caerostris extrusa]|uniref:Uncharacterized protein n=1 Tax=Caerostris extrusa TaxID=172846 RepID=A0AAV4MNC2_CAEEX|nr:hypothetical protein CEXT_104301 [Caerostris extrusa]